MAWACLWKAHYIPLKRILQDAKKRIQHSIDGLNQAIRDLRAYILDLRPRQMGNDGLMSGLKRLAYRVPRQFTR